MVFWRFAAVIAPITFGLIATLIGFELRARLAAKPGRRQIRRAALRRNADGGFDQERSAEPL